MDQIVNLILNEICWGYAASVFLLTFLVLTYVTISPKKWIKILVSVGAGIIVGILWAYTMQAKPTTLLFSFLFQTVFYQWGVKELLKKLGHTYDNKKGVV